MPTPGSTSDPGLPDGRGRPLHHGGCGGADRPPRRGPAPPPWPSRVYSQLWNLRMYQVFTHWVRAQYESRTAISQGK